eukprot:6203473-Pleurochrysis_carterae.AAC.3
MPNEQKYLDKPVRSTEHAPADLPMSPSEFIPAWQRGLVAICSFTSFGCLQITWRELRTVTCLATHLREI